MINRRNGTTLCLVILSALASAAPATAQENEARGQPDWIEMARASAAQNGINLGEAIRRINLQNRAMDLIARLAREDANFAGAYIVRDRSNYRIRIVRKGGPLASIPGLSGDVELQQATDQVTVRYSAAELRAEQDRINAALQGDSSFEGSAISYQDNAVIIYTRDVDHVNRLVSENQLSLAPFVRIEQQTLVAGRDAAVYGGLSIRGPITTNSAGQQIANFCQTGFSVIDYYGVRGVTTADHCDRPLVLSSTGQSLGTVVNARFGGPLDVRHYRNAADTYSNSVRFGASTVQATSAVGSSLMQNAEICLGKLNGTTRCAIVYTTDLHFNDNGVARTVIA